MAARVASGKIVRALHAMPSVLQDGSAGRAVTLPANRMGDPGMQAVGRRNPMRQEQPYVRGGHSHTRVL